MRPRGPPLDCNLPDLPKGCEELTATQAPDSETRLEAHLDCLPGLGTTHADLLSRFAVDPARSAFDDEPEEDGETVLGLEDLLRSNRQGYHTIHPRVQQVVTVGAIESLLETIVGRLEKRRDFTAYQYPRYVLECRGSAPNQTALYPPEYHLSTLDVLRELRANNLLTTVCRPGDSIPSPTTVRAAFDSMKQHGQHPVGAFTLRMAESGSDHAPILAFWDEVRLSGCPGQEQLFDYLSYLCNMYEALLQVRPVSELPEGVRDD